MCPKSKLLLNTGKTRSALIVAHWSTDTNVARGENALAPIANNATLANTALIALLKRQKRTQEVFPASMCRLTERQCNVV